MPPKSKPVPVEPAKLPPFPTWEQLKANAEFRDWHNNPFRRMMTAALRENYPVSGATDPHVIINHAGQLNGWLGAIGAVDTFCEVKTDGDKETPKPIPYQHHQHHQHHEQEN